MSNVSEIHDLMFTDGGALPIPSLPAILTLSLFAYHASRALISPEEDEEIVDLGNSQRNMDPVGVSNAENMLEKMKTGGRRIVIFYGSETGTAQSYASRFAKDVRARLGLSSMIADPSKEAWQQIDQLPDDHIVVFFAATFGEGEPTRNNDQLLGVLEDSELSLSQGKTLENLSYVAFGLGNRTYEHFNGAIRRIDAALQRRGATRLGEIGEGDDDRDLENDYITWVDGAIRAIQAKMGTGDMSVISSPDFKVIESQDGIPQEYPIAGAGPYSKDNPFLANLNIKQLFSPTAQRECLHADIDLGFSGLSYTTGDHLALWTPNPDQMVDRLLSLFGLQAKADMSLHVEVTDPLLDQLPCPSPTSYRTLLRNYLDVSAVASRQILGVFSQYAPSEVARQTLQDLVKHTSEYEDLVVKQHRTLGDVLSYASDQVWSIPFDVVLSAIPPVQPRYYSISTSPNYNPGRVTITTAVVKYLTLGDSHRPFHGLASNYLRSLSLAPATGSKPEDLALAPRYQHRIGSDSRKAAFIHIRSSKFRLPQDPSIPMIMVGPGTGIAPFRGFVQERIVQARSAKPGAIDSWGSMRLYYGCRNRRHDMLYADEWPEYTKELSGKFAMRTAFSREKDYKVYVQDLIREDSKELADLIINHKANIYICGDGAGMAKAVEREFSTILESFSQGAVSLRELKDKQRYHLDVW